MAKSQKIVLIDSNALIHRAFHALPPLQTKTGELVNAVYGFTSTLLKVLSDLKPAYIVATFDRKERTFRHEEYAEYKATRMEAPTEIYEQIPRAKEVLEAFSIPVFEAEGFEADDVIGALSEQAHDKGLETYIVTGDLDTLQLVNLKTKIYTLKRGLQDTIVYNEEEVKKRFGLEPEQLIDFKALKGDASDNIPGVPGIGEKTATQLISDFGSLLDLYKELEKNSPKAKKLPEKLRENIKNYKKEAFFCQKLVTIRKDVPVELDLEKCHLHEYDKNKVFELFQELGFKSLLNRLPATLEDKNFKNGLFTADAISKLGVEPQKAASLRESSLAPKGREIKSQDMLRHSGVDYKIIQKEDELAKLIKQIKKINYFSLDTETTSEDEMEAELVGISFALKEKEGFYVPVGHIIRNKEQGTKNRKNLDLKSTLNQLKPILEDPKIKKCGQNIKYDMVVLLNYGIKLEGIDFDSMVASYLLHPATRAHDLDSVAFTELGIQTLPLTSLIGTGKNQINASEVAIDKLGIYACEDADLALRLKNHFEKHLAKENLEKLFYEIEMPLVPVLAQMEHNGIKIDTKFISEMSEELNSKIANLEKEIYKAIGYEFNINSTQQLSSVLFEVLKLPTNEVKKTKTGISTAAGELEKLKGAHPVIDFILEYRELMKLKTTYVDALPELINKKTNRVHTNFNQAITATGRLSSSNPNLQNIPIRGDYGGQIRKSFVANAGLSLLCVDYSQIELRIIASLSEDERMMKAFEDDGDIHLSTASEIFGVSADKVTKQMRRSAKTINFGIIYGMSSYGLSGGLGISHEEAREYIEKYFNLHHGIKRYIDETIEKAREQGYVETLFGRKRPIAEINSSVFNVRATAERMAINMPVQGTAADLIKQAMIKISDKLQVTSDKAKMLLQVHDELVFEVPKEEVKKVGKLVKDIMENVYEFKVPIKVDLSVGDNWGKLTPLEVA